MQTCSTIVEIRAAIAGLRAAGRTIGFVPTMGALHAGHASLMDAARRDGHATVASIFVNPTQFGPKEDFAAYPRTMQADLALCAAHGVDVVYSPAVGDIYPPGDETRVRVGALGERMCGLSRPGHFEGVCTVVAKLFNIVRPDAAYFGQKDYQQSVIIRRMAADLVFAIDIRVCPIVREADGLAMSSRNKYLSAEDRSRAVCLHAALCVGQKLIEGGERRAGRIVSAMSAVIRDAGPMTIEYLVIADPDALTEQSEVRPPVVLAGAIRIGATRLIDNVLVA